ncbi:MAG: TerB family tellurite resistance protein [Pseudomonadota bacterium]
MSAPSHTVDEILTPLAIAVVIDHKIRSVEQTAFTELANGLLEFFGHPTQSPGEILAWFDDRKDALEDQLWDRGGNTLVLKAITRFAEPAHREAIYDALVTIAVADGEYVPEESRLIKSAAAIYGFERPPIKVTRS